MEEKNKKISKFIYAYDPKINRRVPHRVKDGFATSLVTGTKFKMEKEYKYKKIGIFEEFIYKPLTPKYQSIKYFEMIQLLSDVISNAMIRGVKERIK